MLQDEQKPFHEQKTIQDRPRHDPKTKQRSEKSTWAEQQEESLPAWPPPPHPRPAQGTPEAVKVLTLILALVLVAGGLSFIIYATTNQYSQALGITRRASINATVRNEIKSQATLVNSLVETAIPLATAQAQIVASATAQDQPSATAQAQSDQDQATATALNATLTQDTTATPTVNDPLIDNTLHYQWDIGYADDNATGCHFAASGYEVQEVRQGFIQPCFADATNFKNFVYQVSMTITAGNEGGIIFRGNKAKGEFYLFRIDINGAYALDLYNGSQYARLASGKNQEISTGTGASNDLTVIANPNNLSLFVNQSYITGVSDQTLSTGQIGVAALNLGLPCTVDFSNAEVWTLASSP